MKIGVATKKYIYTLEEVPAESLCKGCFFYRFYKNGNKGSWISTCWFYTNYRYLIKQCRASRIIYKQVGKRLKDPDSLIGNKEAHY